MMLRAPVCRHAQGLGEGEWTYAGHPSARRQSQLDRGMRAAGRIGHVKAEEGAIVN